MTYHAKVTTGGKVVIPADSRREFGIKDGDSVLTERGVDGITLRREDRDAAQTRMREAFKGYSVDRFLRDRRADRGE